MVSLARCMAALHIEEIEADGAGLRSFGADAVADRLLCVFRYKAFQLGLGSLVLKMGRPGPQEDRRKLCPSIGALMSIIRTASTRGFGGSTPNRRGGSPLSTQRQNLRSAVTSGVDKADRQGT